MKCMKQHIAYIGEVALHVFAAQKNLEPQQAFKDADIVFCAQSAMGELSSALGEDSAADLTFEKQLTGEEIVQAASDEGVLVSAVLESRLAGIYPYYLEKILAGILLSQAEKGVALRDTLIQLTGVGSPDILFCILEQAEQMKQGFAMEDSKKIDYMKKAYSIGFETEKTYKGCGQCAIMAIDQLMGTCHEDIFKCATGFSGGMALCGDGVCGGYAGGMMMLCLQQGRSLQPMKENGDKENQYAGYEASQMLHDKFFACYGSPVCEKIHEGMFDGESFILRTKERRNEFEEAGAHKVVCTTVVALACAWVAEILVERGLVSL